MLDKDEEMFANICLVLTDKTKAFALLLLYNKTLAIIIIIILLTDFFLMIYQELLHLFSQSFNI